MLYARSWTSMIEYATLERRGRRKPSPMVEGMNSVHARSLPRSADDNPRIIAGQFASIHPQDAAGGVRVPTNERSRLHM